jgi:hypothetical protein
MNDEITYLDDPTVIAMKARYIQLHAQFGPRCWALLYQADARCRSENMERLRFQLLTKHNKAVKAGLPTTFDTTHPWDSVWAAAVKDRDFWEQEFSRHALMIATNTLAVEQTLGDDARVMGANSAPASSYTGQPTKKPNPKAASAPQKAAVCRNFNVGSCLGLTCGSGYGKHICTLCGSPKHGAFECPRIRKKQQEPPANKEQGDKRKWGKHKKNKA